MLIRLGERVQTASGAIARATGSALVAFAAAATLSVSAQAAAPTVTSVTPWKSNAAPMAWAGGRIYYNAKGAGGVYDGWSANPDGTGAVCLTCAAGFPATTHHGVSDVTPDGRYALVTVERSAHWPLS